MATATDAAERVEPAIADTAALRREVAQRTHRPDIDGLRAIAVTSVILLHAGLWMVAGGYLGVDVFFVISGYLIHKDLMRRLRTGSFTPVAFYARRMRRTIPALYVVTALTLFVAMFVLMPSDFDATARSAIATGLSISNIFFLSQVGYFDHDAVTKPLLHTWSLGVEEQFYLFAPLLSYGLYRAGEVRQRLVYAGLFALAFGLCVALQRIAPAAAFFLMPTRIWEFLIGCAVADGLAPAISRRKTAEIVTLTAFVALIGALVFINDESPHPGLPTLIPCLATAAIIHAGATHETRLSRWLGWRPIAFVGLISYSLYLWHWPVIVFARYLDLGSAPLTDAALVVGTFAVSVVSWRFVERPFRDPASPWRRRAGPVLACGLGLIVASAGAIVATRGAPQRFSPAVREITSYLDYADRRQFREGTCFLTSHSPSLADFDRAKCLKLASDRPNYLLIGDSLAAHFWIGFSKVYPNANILQATASGCRPILDSGGARYCVDLMNLALKQFLPDAHLDGIIFSASWGTGNGDQLARTVDEVKAHVGKVVVLGHVPDYDSDLPLLLARGLVAHRPNLVVDHQLGYTWELDEEFRDTIPHEDFYSLVDLLCPAHVCATYAPGHVPLEFDKSHLTTEGSIFTVQRLKASGLRLDRVPAPGAPLSGQRKQ